MAEKGCKYCLGLAPFMLDEGGESEAYIRMNCIVVGTVSIRILRCPMCGRLLCE